MPHAREWANQFEKGIKKYGISVDKIYRYSDVDYYTMYDAIIDARKKTERNAEDGRRTLLLCFYAGHGATVNSETYALFNSNDRVLDNQFSLEYMLGRSTELNGAYVISLFACDRYPMPEEEEEEEEDSDEKEEEEE